mmetsp:Transcript_107483/g.302491  ORF Transcript_107483/g.302491 Transcript_107483/m.302491 type:complete len:200 (+) Transcript_107483:355-954(+)
MVPMAPDPLSILMQPSHLDVFLLRRLGLERLFQCRGCIRLKRIALVVLFPKVQPDNDPTRPRRLVGGGLRQLDVLSEDAAQKVLLQGVVPPDPSEGVVPVHAAEATEREAEGRNPDVALVLRVWSPERRPPFRRDDRRPVGVPQHRDNDGDEDVRRVVEAVRQHELDLHELLEGDEECHEVVDRLAEAVGHDLALQQLE